MSTPPPLPSPEPTPCWRPPAPSRATRKISRRSNRSARVTIVTTTNPRLIRCESNLEAKAAYMLLARPDVVDVTEQPEAVAYLDEQDRRRLHTFDFLVTRADGTRIAIAVKPAKTATRRGLLRLLRRIAAQMSPDFADAVLLLTEEQLPGPLVRNAMMIHGARRGRCEKHDAQVAALVRTLNGRVKVGTLVEVLGLGGEGYRAILRALGDGLLSLVGRRSVEYDSWLMPAGAVA
ncbi:hypothetical protein AEGHOMDF_0712 [Methylobacterium soli]|nr:hypothetical protein AEGHOMDF_0712 [Methylobacterium soli]